MKKKTVYLHVGTTKTGSTSIQMFLRENRLLLREHSVEVYTPRSGTDDRRKTGLRKPVEEMDPLRRLLGGGSQISRLLDELKNLEAERIVLSEEVFWDVIACPRRRRVFARFLQSLSSFSEVRVIVYLRRQDTFLMSAYQQQLKRGWMNGLTCSQWLQKKNSQPRRNADYLESLQWLVSQLGRENLMVRPFEAGQFAGGQLESDFLKSIGFDHMPESLQPARRHNAGMSAALA